LQKVHKDAKSEIPQLPSTQRESEELKTHLNGLLNWGYIFQSKSPYGALVLFVYKKDDKLRMCMNYHALNKITIKK
jgi:hypothetical protein